MICMILSFCAGAAGLSIVAAKAADGRFESPAGELAGPVVLLLSIAAMVPLLAAGLFYSALPMLFWR